ncbi:MAG: hypothetical protein ACRC0G_05715 [Fusobacteriaceae bacterium]
MIFEIISLDKVFIESTLKDNLNIINNEFSKRLITDMLVNDHYYEKMALTIAEQLFVSYEKGYFSENGENSPIKRLITSEDTTSIIPKKTFRSRFLYEGSDGTSKVFLEVEENVEYPCGLFDFIVIEMGNHLSETSKKNNESIKNTVEEIAKIIVDDVNQNLTNMLKNENLNGKDDEIVRALLFAIFGPEVIFLDKKFIESVGRNENN